MSDRRLQGSSCFKGSARTLFDKRASSSYLEDVSLLTLHAQTSLPGGEEQPATQVILICVSSTLENLHSKPPLVLNHCHTLESPVELPQFQVDCCLDSSTQKCDLIGLDCSQASESKSSLVSNVQPFEKYKA